MMIDRVKIFFKVKEIIVHPQYNQRNLGYTAAILILEEGRWFLLDIITEAASMSPVSVQGQCHNNAFEERWFCYCWEQISAGPSYKLYPSITIFCNCNTFL